MQKLPKQWRDWCRKAGLKPSYGSRRPYVWFYLKGHGRMWRLNCHGQLQCGDTLAEFDRWALSTIVEAPKPVTRDAFIATVRSLLAEARQLGAQGTPAVDEAA